MLNIKDDSIHHAWNFLFGWSVCELVSGSGVLNLDFWVQIDSIEQPIKRNSVVSGNMSHCGLLPLMIILITASLSSKIYNKVSWCENWSFEGIKSTFSKTLITAWDCFRFLNCVTCWTNFTFVLKRFSPFFTTLIRVSKNCDDQDPITQVRRYHQTSILHPKKRFLILLNCAKLKFVSYTSNWLEHTCDFQKTHNVPPKVNFESSRSPAKSESWNNPRPRRNTQIFRAWYFSVAPAEILDWNMIL